MYLKIKADPLILNLIEIRSVDRTYLQTDRFDPFVVHLFIHVMQGTQAYNLFIYVH
jgi:hypothetical protein